MKAIKKFICVFLAILTALNLLCLWAFAGDSCDALSEDYIVLIGEDSSIVSKKIKTDLLVIDGEYFTKEDVARLKKNGAKRVYTYINIGSIESFRNYYSIYEKYTLGDYENWPEEKWIDVSQPQWQAFIGQRANELAGKGFDGFFVDNTDVYYAYKSEGIYEGIVTILKSLKAMGKSVIINGGDTFVSRYISSGGKEVVFDGINQENVYTSYNFASKTYGVNDIDDRAYYVNYCSTVLKNGYNVYVLEYANSTQNAFNAQKFDEGRGYICYVSDNIELKMPERPHIDDNSDGVCDNCGKKISPAKENIWAKIIAYFKSVFDFIRSIFA